jgi:hypothetical protein
VTVFDPSRFAWPRQLLRNRRFLSNLTEVVEKAPVPSIILHHGASITLSTHSVRISDGRIGRVREVIGPKCRVRVRRTTSDTHQFLIFIADDLKRVDCPKGWMSPEGYVRYLDTTLAKMRKRDAPKKRRRSKRD